MTAAIDDLETWIGAYEQASAEESKWRGIKDQAKDVLLGRLKDAGALAGTVAGKVRVQRKPVKGRFDQKRFGKEHPDIIEEYRSADSYRFEIVDA